MRSISFNSILVLVSLVSCSNPNAVEKPSLLETFPDPRDIRTVTGIHGNERTEFELTSEKIKPLLNIFLEGRSGKRVRNPMKWETWMRIDAIDKTGDCWQVGIYNPVPGAQFRFSIDSPGGREYFIHESLTYEQLDKKIKTLLKGND